MSLITCPACDREVSDKADRCPQCGHPIARGFLGRAGAERAINVGCLMIVLVLIVLGFLTMCTAMVR